MEPTIVFKKSKAKANLRKRVPRQSPESSSDLDDSASSQDDAKPRGRHVKRLKTKAGVQSSTTTATATTKSSSKDLFPTPNGADTTVTIPSQADTATASARSVGPVKTSANVRITVTTDFAPDVCKDYKQTGFCGFGDNCKFLHSREDYKQGWQLDREWENVTQGKKKLSGTVVASAGSKTKDEKVDSDDESFLESIPFACIICKESYKQPIVTKCGHYFCEACALKRYRKDPSCAACAASTNGVFNSAKRLEKLLEKKRERAARRQPDSAERGDGDEG